MSAMTLLYEWEIIAGLGASERIGPCGVTDSESQARKLLGHALMAAPRGISVQGRITVVVLRLDRAERGYERGRRVALARRGVVGPIRWIAVQSGLPASTPPALSW